MWKWNNDEAESRMQLRSSGTRRSGCFFFSNRNDYSILADVMFSFLEYAIDTISCFFNANLTNPKYVKSFIRRFYSDDLLNIDLVYFPNDEINHSNG